MKEGDFLWKFSGNRGNGREKFSRRCAAHDAVAPAGSPDDVGGAPVAAPEVVVIYRRAPGTTAEQPRRANALPKRVIAGLRPAKKSRDPSTGSPVAATIN